MKINFLPINKDNIKQQPDRFITTIKGIDFIFQISWNPEVKGFFCDLYNSNEDPIILGKKITYGEDILANLIDDRAPSVKIIPLDKTSVAEKEGINLENFMTSIKPYIFEGDS